MNNNLQINFKRLLLQLRLDAFSIYTNKKTVLIIGSLFFISLSRYFIRIDFESGLLDAYGRLILFFNSWMSCLISLWLSYFLFSKNNKLDRSLFHLSSPVTAIETILSKSIILFAFVPIFMTLYFNLLEGVVFLKSGQPYNAMGTPYIDYSRVAVYVLLSVLMMFLAGLKQRLLFPIIIGGILITILRAFLPDIILDEKIGSACYQLSRLGFLGMNHVPGEELFYDSSYAIGAIGIALLVYTIVFFQIKEREA